MPRRRRSLAALALLTLGAASTTAVLAAGALAAPTCDTTLCVGVGRSDITPPNGYFFQGWVRSDSYGIGVHSRLNARVLVVKKGSQKVALVAEDLNGIPGGLFQEAVARVADLGYTEQNVVDSASHTHSTPGQTSNFATYNTVFMTTKDARSVTDQNVSGALDPDLYRFEVEQLAAAIRAADADLAPGRLGWSSTLLSGLTQNRSLEAHLANYGIKEDRGTGTVAQDPNGYDGTIDPVVEVLRADKVVDGKNVPVGVWTTFACHGTVVKASFQYYDSDHSGSAIRGVEDGIRAEGGTPAGQEVLSVFGGSDLGDQTAGIVNSGPADAEKVGRTEAAAMMSAWREAGKNMSADLALDLRWTRVGFTGQTPTGADAPVDTQGRPGLPLFTGSEEGRGPLYDVTQVPFEGMKLPADSPLMPAQGTKIVVDTSVYGVRGTDTFPSGVPLLVVRIGDRLITSVPGEMTVSMGERLRKAVRAALGADSPVTHVVISGLANEYLSYFCTPEEFEAQHYEGGSQHYGKNSSLVLVDGLVALTKALAAGTAAPAPFAFDPKHGVTVTGAPYGTGAASATATTQPSDVQRLQRAKLVFTGGAKGLDRPVGSAFVTVQRLLADGTWARVTDDLGLQIIWGSDGDKGSGTTYTVQWEVPRDAAVGTYRMVVTGKRYRLESGTFGVSPTTALQVVQGTAAGTVQVQYPRAAENTDITFRPVAVDGGTVAGAPLTAGTGSATTVAAGAALDAYGNCNGSAFGTSGTVTVCPASAPAEAAVVPPGTSASGSGSLAATGLPSGLAALGLVALGAGAVLVRRRVRA